MACSLAKDATGDWSALTGAQVTIGIIANNTKLVAVHYNNVAKPVDNDKTSTFTIVAGSAPVVLVMASVKENLEIVEVCPDGGTQHVRGFINRTVASFDFWVEGK
jgi:hypothetical protein